MAHNGMAAGPARILVGSASPRRRALQAARVTEGHEPLVFVVDPDASARSLLVLGLTRQGFRVAAHESAEAASEALKHGGALPSVILCEADLQPMDGFSFCSQLRASPETADLPFVLLSRKTETVHRELATSSGVDQLLPKPLFLSDIVALTQLLAGERPAPTTFTCESDEVALVPLLRALLAGNRSGRLELKGQGHLAFREGFVVDAAMDAGRGVSALTRLLLGASGSWSVTFGPSLVPASFSLGLEELCASVLPAVERWHALLPRCVPLDAVLEVNPAALAKALERLPDSVLALVRLFDGQRTVRECVLNGPLDEVTALKVATRMYLMGIVVKGTGDSSPAPLATRVEVTRFERKGSGSSPGKVSYMRNRRRPTAPLLALPMIPSVSAEQLAQAGQAIPIEPPEPEAASLLDANASSHPLEPFASHGALELAADPFLQPSEATDEIRPRGDDELTPVMHDAWTALELDPSLARHMAAFNIQEVKDAAADAALAEAGVEEVGPEDLLPEDAEALRHTPRIPADVARAFETAENENSEAPRMDALTPPEGFDDFTYDEFLTELESSPRADIRDEAREAREAAPMLPQRDGEETHTPSFSSLPVGPPPELDLAFLEQLSAPVVASARPERRKGFELPSSVALGIGGFLVAGAVVFALSRAPEYHPHVSASDGAQGQGIDEDALSQKAAAAGVPTSPLRTLPAGPTTSLVRKTAAEPVAAVAKGRDQVTHANPASVAPASVTGSAPGPAAAASTAGATVALSSKQVAAAAVTPSPAPKTRSPANAVPSALPGGEISLARGMKLYDQGKMREASRVLARVVEQMPTSSQAWLMLGLARFDAGDAEQALSAARKALELEPQNGRGIMLLATIYLEAGDQARGREALERYLQLEPKGKFAEEARLILSQRR